MDRIRNDDMRRRSGIPPIQLKLHENRLRCDGYVLRAINEPGAKRTLQLEVHGRRDHGRPRQR